MIIKKMNFITKNQQVSFYINNVEDLCLVNGILFGIISNEIPYNVISYTEKVYDNAVYLTYEITDNLFYIPTHDDPAVRDAVIREGILQDMFDASNLIRSNEYNAMIDVSLYSEFLAKRAQYKLMKGFNVYEDDLQRGRFGFPTKMPEYLNNIVDGLPEELAILKGRLTRNTNALNQHLRRQDLSQYEQ